MIAAASVSGVGQRVNWSSAGFIAWVQDVMRGNVANNGFSIQVDGASGFNVVDSDGGADGDRPALSITYTAGGGGGSNNARRLILGSF